MIALGDRLRVELDGYLGYNLLPNHSGQDGTTGWAAGAGVTLAAITDAPSGSYDGKALRTTVPAAVSTNVIYTPAVEVTGTGNVLSTWAISLVSRDVLADNVRLGIQVKLQRATLTDPNTWTDYNGQGGGGITRDAYYGGSWRADRVQTMDEVNPFSGIVIARGYRYRVGIRLVTSTAGDLAATTNAVQVIVSKAFFAVLPDVGLFGSEPFRSAGLRFHDATAPQNVLGSHNKLTITRGTELAGVNRRIRPSVVTGTIRDAALDPVANTRVRPNRGVRIRVNTGTASTPVWVDLAVCKLDTLDVTYGQTRPDIAFTTTDDIQRIAALPASPASTPYGLTNGALLASVSADSKGGDLATVFAYGAESDTTTDPLPAESDRDTARLPRWTWGADDLLEQLAVLTDTSYGYMWADWSGMLQLRAPSAKPSATPAWSLTDRLNLPSTGDGSGTRVPYTDIKIGFGSRDLVNTFTVKKVNPTSEALTDGEKVYGPYRDQGSVAQWGEQPAETTIIYGDPKARAVVLAKTYAQAKRLPTQITFNALHDEQALLCAARLDVYQAVRVLHTPTGTDVTCRIVNIRHDITAAHRSGGARWTVTLDLAPLEADPPVTLQNPPGGAMAGPADLESPARGILASRYLAADVAIANSTWTSIPFSAQDVADGIAYDTTNRRFTIPKDGRYLLTARVLFVSNSSGGRFVRVQVNNTVLGQSNYPAGNVHGVLARTLRLAAGDVVYVQAFQNSGANLNLLSGYGSTAADLTYLGS